VDSRMGHSLFTTHPHAAMREWRSMGWAEDSVLVLDRGEGNEEPVGLTDEEWEKLLGEEPFEEDA
jgi:hypothetical protein